MTDQTPTDAFAEAVADLFAELDRRGSLEHPPPDQPTDDGTDWADDLMRQIATDTERNH